MLYILSFFVMSMTLEQLYESQFWLFAAVGIALAHHINTSRLKELVGHTWGEVSVGFLVGLLVAFIAYR